VGILWSQERKLAAAVDALTAWEDAAGKAGVHVESITLVVLNDDPAKPGSRVIFDWQEGAGEYAMRTAGD
jgi:hypothetical protein